jgi:hypothetical protein
MDGEVEEPGTPFSEPFALIQNLWETPASTARKGFVDIR